MRGDSSKICRREFITGRLLKKESFIAEKKCTFDCKIHSSFVHFTDKFSRQILENA